MSVIWKLIYNLVGKHPSLNAHDTLLNLGYLTDEQMKKNPSSLIIKQNLYRQVIANLNLENKTILEVGSGRGGGAHYLAIHDKPARYIGLDFAKQNVNFSNEHFARPNLEFITGNAMKLPFPDSYVDIVINVESSHCYENVDRFLSEVARVLKPGGYFCFADILPKSQLTKLKKQILRDFTLQIEEEITPQVLNALVTTENDIRHTIQEFTSGWKKIFRRLFYVWAVIPGSPPYRALKKKKLRYVHLLATVQKPAKISAL